MGSGGGVVLFFIKRVTTLSFILLLIGGRVAMSLIFDKKCDRAKMGAQNLEKLPDCGKCARDIEKVRRNLD